MDSTFSLPPPLFTTESAEAKNRRKKLLRKLIIATLLALSIHIFFFLVIYPYLSQYAKRLSTTEITQISPQELAQIKKANEQSRYLPPLLEQELNEKYKTKEKPKDAKFIAPFNQSVPEETVAGAQPDAPKKGSGGQRSQTVQEKSESKPIQLSNIGLGSKVSKPVEREHSDASGPVAQGPPGPSRPVGRDDPHMKKSNQNMLNAVESEYYSFFARFEDPIVRNWYFLLRNSEPQIRAEFSQRYHRQEAELPVTVEFTIDRQGNFVAIDLLQSSGVPMLDSSTLEAVRRLRSLPNPPPGIFEGKNTFTYRLQFVVTLTNTPMMDSAPGMNWY